jgi:ATP-binding cassette subfamily C protein LapB
MAAEAAETSVPTAEPSPRLAARAAKLIAMVKDKTRELWAQIGAMNPFETPPIKTPSVGLLQIPPNIVLGSIVINLLGFALPLVVLQVYDRVIPNQSLGTLLLLVGGAILCIIAELALRLARAYIIGWNATKFACASSADALERMLKAPPRLDKSPARIDDDFRTLDQLADRYSGQFRLALLDVPFVFLFLAMLFMAGGWLALIPVATTIFVGIRTLEISRRIRTTVRDRVSNDDKRFDFLNECLAHIETTKSLALEAQLLRRAEALQRQTTRVHFDSINATTQAQNLGMSLANVTNIFIVSAGALQVINGSMSVGAVAACSLLASRLIQPILRLSSTWTDLQSINIEIETCQALFPDAEAPAAEPAKPIPSAPPISVRALRFATRDGAQNHVDSLTVSPGGCIAISAENAIASGTFFEILNGRAKALTGSAAIAGLNALEDRMALRTTIGLLPESPATFAGTLLENLTLFGGAATADDAYAVCRDLGIEQFVHALPAGYETDLASPQSDAFQHGLSKMAALARLILQKRPVLLLKNPQSGLSAPYERALARYMRTRPREQTILMLTDSPALIAAADRAYSFVGGRLEEMRGDARSSADEKARA